MNITHQQKKLNEQELREFRSRFSVPISDEDIDTVPFYRPSESSPEMKYLLDRRKELGGSIPSRRIAGDPIVLPPDELYHEFFEGTREHEVSTTMVFVRILTKLLRDPAVGRLIVPIVSDEARTFGMEALFRQIGIYSHAGQLYEPVDRENLLYYKESTDGQILEEGITEAGSMSSFIAAGTAYSTHGVNTIPFFIFYSMFGFQRIGDLIWAASDMRTRGFLLGATSGRTTLAGEGLQHADGHSHLLAFHIPTLQCYDPAYAYELAVIVRDGLRRMYVNQESLLYYVTVMNENYPQPPMPPGIEEGILRGIYKFRDRLEGGSSADSGTPVHLFGSGAILNKVLAAQTLLQEKFGLASDVWSVTSYKQLHREAILAERQSLFDPGRPKSDSDFYLDRVLAESAGGVFVAVTDYVRAIPDSISRWIPGRFLTLGTDGFGRSDGRRHLREHFEIDERFIALAAISGLVRESKLDPSMIQKAISELKIDPNKPNPILS